ncbi:MAG: hypothetical protein H7Y43_15230, partial [Akkermansiaceae bacterium]|nr:hypothetical protein [Verrucomicrobiales bacterium]
MNLLSFRNRFVRPVPRFSWSTPALIACSLIALASCAYQQPARPSREQLRTFAALEQKSFKLRPPGGSGYFLVLANQSLGLGILIPTVEIVEDGKPVHNYIVDTQRNKVVGEIAGPDLHFFGQNHGGISAQWNRRPGTGGEV